MNYKILYILIALALPLATQAQYMGPNWEAHVSNVSEIKPQSSDMAAQQVVIKVVGNITKQITHSTFEFKDKTGTITVVIKHNVLPNTIFDDKTRIMILGHIESHTENKPVIYATRVFIMDERE